jgi:hypothetical protein
MTLMVMNACVSTPLADEPAINGKSSYKRNHQGEYQAAPKQKAIKSGLQRPGDK